MSLYAMSEGVELAVLRCTLALQESLRDDVRTVFAHVEQASGGAVGFGC